MRIGKGALNAVKMLTEAVMWEAVVNNDRNYDGIFYYGVRSTRIFCRPSCKSKLPLRKNVSFFAAPQDAVKADYRPCKRCRPDLLHSYIEPIREVNDLVTAILTEEYSNPYILEELSRRVGVSPFHLQRCYKKHTGQTPKAFLQDVRIKRAKVLLEENKLSNTEICYMVGFSSLSSFYAAFRAEAGVSPRQYKRNNCEMGGDGHEYCI